VGEHRRMAFRFRPQNVTATRFPPLTRRTDVVRGAFPKGMAE
jgi:hypothetical protein